MVEPVFNDIIPRTRAQRVGTINGGTTHINFSFVNHMYECNTHITLFRIGCNER